jgi:hypothetical protein
MPPHWYISTYRKRPKSAFTCNEKDYLSFSFFLGAIIKFKLIQPVLFSGLEKVLVLINLDQAISTHISSTTSMSLYYIMGAGATLPYFLFIYSESRVVTFPVELKVFMSISLISFMDLPTIYKYQRTFLLLENS